MVTPRDTQELVEAVRASLRQGERAMMELTWTHANVNADALLTELAERLEAAERNAALNRKRGDVNWNRAEAAEHDLASSQAAALLLHKRVEELEEQLTERDGRVQMWTRNTYERDRQLAERDKRIEGLREALLEIRADDPTSEQGMMADVALADPVVVPERAPADATPFEKPKMQTPGVVVPGWDDGTWNQGC